MQLNLVELVTSGDYAMFLLYLHIFGLYQLFFIKKFVLNIVCFLLFCRLFDLSSNLIQPEQEYYLQPAKPGRHRNATSICPVDFSFGGDHLWDRFSVSNI